MGGFCILMYLHWEGSAGSLPSRLVFTQSPYFSTPILPQNELQDLKKKHFFISSLKDILPMNSVHWTSLSIFSHRREYIIYELYFIFLYTTQKSKSSDKKIILYLLIKLFCECYKGAACVVNSSKYWALCSVQCTEVNSEHWTLNTEQFSVCGVKFV